MGNYLKRGNTTIALSANNTFILRNRTVSAEDIVSIDRNVTSIALDRCPSYEWVEVFRKIADLPEVV
jgi:hypothetical protein